MSTLYSTMYVAMLFYKAWQIHIFIFSLFFYIYVCCVCVCVCVCAYIYLVNTAFKHFWSNDH